MSSIKSLGLRQLLSFSRRKCVFNCIKRRNYASLSQSANYNYCLELVKKNDYENYLACLLLPKVAQRAVFALRAFNVELAQVRDSVSERQIGLMKMRFWKDTIDNIFQSSQSTVPHTPVAFELAGACGYFKLSKQWLQKIIDARTQQLERDNFTSVKSVEDYADQVNASLYFLMLECLRIKNIHADHAASHLGKAQGLVTVLRATPYHASRRQVFLPMETLAKHKVSQEDIVRGKNSQQVKDAVFDVASIANHHLTKARSLKDTLPPQSQLVFLNASVCDHYLKTLQKVDFNIFDGKLQQKNPLLAMEMYFNRLRKKF